MTTGAAARAQQIIADGFPVGPRMHPCVCGAGRHAHSGKNATGGAKDTGCRRYRPDVAWELAYKAVDAQATRLGKSLREYDRQERVKHYKNAPRKPGEWSIGASDTTTCPKKIEYRNKPPEGFVPDWEDGREALMGKMIHDQTTEALKALYPWRLYGLKVTIKGLDRQSELDWFDPLTGDLTDLKTAGDYKWDSLGDHGPDEDVWGQPFLYGLALEDMGYDVRTITLVYLHRAKGHDEPFTRPYDRAFAEKYRDQLLGYAQALDLGIPLEKTEPGPSHSELCRRCFARSDCWNLVPAAAAGRSPESYTILGPTPADEDIIWAISEKVRTSAERLAADKAEDQAKTLLEGIEAGRYGDFEGYEAWSPGGTDWKAWAETLATYYGLPEDERPDLDTLGIPQKRRRPYVKFGKVRKATLDRERREAAALDKEKAS